MVPGGRASKADATALLLDSWGCHRQQESSLSWAAAITATLLPLLAKKGTRCHPEGRTLLPLSPSALTRPGLREEGQRQNEQLPVVST